MANWCETEYTFVGNNADLDAAYQLLREIKNHPESAEENTFGRTFLGHLLSTLGEDYHRIPCRGMWRGLTRHSNRLTLITTTAYSPLNEVWDLFCSRFPSLKYYYYSEEEGCQNFLTNDLKGRFYPERYAVNCYDEVEDEWRYARFATSEEVINFVSFYTGRFFSSLTQIQDELKDCSINKIEYVSNDMEKALQFIIKGLHNNKIKIETSKFN